MSFKVMRWALAQRMESPTDKLVLVTLAHHAKDHGECFPGVRKICEITALKERAVRYSLKRLAKDGFLWKKDHFRRNGSDSSNHYFLAVGTYPKGRLGKIDEDKVGALNAPSTVHLVQPSPALNAPPEPIKDEPIRDQPKEYLLRDVAKVDALKSLPKKWQEVVLKDHSEKILFTRVSVTDPRTPCLA